MSKIETDSLTETNGRTLSSGLIVEELEAGEIDGKVASSGKKASATTFCCLCVHYNSNIGEMTDLISISGHYPLYW